MRAIDGAGAALAALCVSVGFAHTITIDVVLAGEHEVPPNNSPAFGSATVIVDTHTGSTTILGVTSGLLAPMSAAHLHGLAPPGENAGVLIGLAVNGSFFQGNGVLAPAQLQGLLDGLTYLNVHTSAFPGGEIRGQLIVPVPPEIVVHVHLEGGQEVPPNNSPGVGEAEVTIVQDTTTISIEGSFNALLGTPAAAHLHGPGPAGQNAPVILPLEIKGDHFHGHGELTGAQFEWVLQGLTYINVHTDLFPGGEIRGQVLPQLPQGAPPCPGDVTGDEIVDGADLAVVLGQWNTLGPDGDINGDTTVDGADLAIVLGTWGSCPEDTGIVYAGQIPGVVIQLDTIDGPKDVTGTMELGLRLRTSPKEGVYIVDAELASLSLSSVDIGGTITGGIGMRQDLVSQGSIGAGGEFQIPFDFMTHYAVLDELVPPSPSICTEIDPSDGFTMEELWHGVLDGSVVSLGDELSFEGELHLHVHNPRSGLVSTAEVHFTTTLPHKEYPGLESCVRASRRTNARNLTIQPVFIGTGPDDPNRTGTSFADMKAKADALWGKCCLEFTWLEPKYIDNNDYKTLSKVAPDANADVWAEWRALAAEEDAKGENEAIEVFFVSTFETADGNPHASGDGLTFGSGTKSAKIFVADGAVDDCAPKSDGVLAHELGHACGSCKHPDGKAGAAGSVMEPTGKARPNCPGVNPSIVKDEQCLKMARGPLAKEKTPKSPCCKNTD